jgi:uncharacterized protein (TIGR02118 family)
MLKVLALIKRLPTLDRKAFREHYENRHVEVAKPLLRHLVRYARHHIEEELHGEVDFDVVTSLGYPDKPALDATFAMLASDVAEPILEDERRFMDKPANRFFEVSERVWKDGEEEDRSIFVFVARPPDMTRTSSSRSLLRDHWPALLAGATDLRFAIVRDAFPMADRPLVFDGVMQLCVDSGAEVREFSSALSEKGFRVVAVQTRRYATAVPQG